jgi:hypothetical protein
VVPNANSACIQCGENPAKEVEMNPSVTPFQQNHAGYCGEVGIEANKTHISKKPLRLLPPSHIFYHHLISHWRELIHMPML